ncbi:hypothetical protein [Burkholderia pseudomallei]|nr:hypothetical protein [Burkholderia pseudomallei]AIV92019.1 hypothetical protein X995_1570 [Burkholderia pseudomallei B03]AIV95878.1 hypothetical protein X996_1522 [Burkholderia pseudomallei A79A]KGU98313.1 hypothetical protein X885_2108 [Burkholderia pseudomallei MSHR4372]KGV13120.1 hypothetical protein X881_2330 [Burkholderia pseudomallei MSHR4300]KGV89393.1 hypothetical protein X897_616 [Burkholderia pseudomallei ABCPW 30]
MNDTQHPIDFPTLTNEQICELAAAVYDDFGGDLLTCPLQTGPAGV